MTLVKTPSYPLAIVGLILIFLGALLLLATAGIPLHPFSFVEVEAGEFKIRIGDIPVATATALWSGAILLIIGAGLLVSAFRK